MKGAAGLRGARGGERRGMCCGMYYDLYTMDYAYVYEKYEEITRKCINLNHKLREFIIL